MEFQISQIGIPIWWLFNSKILKKVSDQNIWNLKRNQDFASDGVPEIRTKNWYFQPSQSSTGQWQSVSKGQGKAQWLQFWGKNWQFLAWGGGVGKCLAIATGWLGNNHATINKCMGGFGLERLGEGPATMLLVGDLNKFAPMLCEIAALLGPGSQK
jgi:hypothetical protein